MSNNELLSYLLFLEGSFRGPLYKRLIERIRETGDIDAVVTGATAISGMTMLQVAAAHGDAEMVNKLIDYGANINAPDYSGTPLLLSRMKILCSLVKSGSEPSQIERETNIVTLLIKRGADLSLRDPSMEEKEISGTFKDAADYVLEIQDEALRNRIASLIYARKGKD